MDSVSTGPDHKGWQWICQWGPLAAYMAAIFLVSAQSSLPKMPGELGWDKLQHGAAYAVMALLAVRATIALPSLRGAKPYLAALAITAAYGAVDEFHQSFVPNRSPDPCDWLADMVGAVSALLIVALVVYLRRRRAR